MRRSADRLYVRRLGPREQEAYDTVAANPGMTVGELREASGVSKGRVWQIIVRLEWGRVRREGDPPARRLKPH